MHANGRQRQTAVHQDAAILDHFCTRVIHSSMHSFLTHARQTQQASLLEQPTVSNHFGSVLPSNARVLLRLKVLDAMRHFMSSSCKLRQIYRTDAACVSGIHPRRVLRPCWPLQIVTQAEPQDRYDSCVRCRPQMVVEYLLASCSSSTMHQQILLWPACCRYIVFWLMT